MESESGTLSESLFFTARKAPLHSHSEKSTGVASTSSSSSKYYSARIHTLMKLKSERGMSEKDAEIEASKSHWTEVESNRYYTPVTSGRESSTSETTGETTGEGCGVEMTEDEWVELYKENLEEMRRLKMENEKSIFFHIDGKVAGEIFAKGGQATIYEHWVDIEGQSVPMVMKVFEAGYSVRELRKQWPIDLLRQRIAHMTVGVRLWNLIVCGRLLDDGRFAFEMLKYWGDVRKLLDVRMEHNGNRYGPFMMEDGSYVEGLVYRIWFLIARGMKGLHDEGILHRDLKASNVLIESETYFNNTCEENRFNPLEPQYGFLCYIADYECSIGVVGTGFWRAPEIMEAIRNRTLDTNPSLFTQKVDVYSYAMTCYEILTGFIPFEHPEDERTNVDEVLEGKRPTLPQHLQPWVMNLFQKCWDPDPLERPTFTKILEILEEC